MDPARLLSRSGSGRGGTIRGLARDAVAYLSHPRTTSRRAIRERRLGEALAITVLGIVLTALPPTLVPATRDPPQIPRPYAVGLTWLGAHRPVFALAAFVGLALVSTLGYALTLAAVVLLRPAADTDWRGVLAGLGRINALSVLSALVPLPGVVMQIAGVPGYIPVDIALIPPAVGLGGWVVVPAWWTLRDGAGLGPWQAVMAFAVPVLVSLSLGAVIVVAVFQLIWGGA